MLNVVHTRKTFRTFSSISNYVLQLTHLSVAWNRRDTTSYVELLADGRMPTISGSMFQSGWLGLDDQELLDTTPDLGAFSDVKLCNLIEAVKASDRPGFLGDSFMFGFLDGIFALTIGLPLVIIGLLLILGSAFILYRYR